MKKEVPVKRKDKDEKKDKENTKKIKKILHHGRDDEYRDVAERAMEDYKAGKLTVGKNKKKVKSKAEAVRIALGASKRVKAIKKSKKLD